MSDQKLPPIPAKAIDVGHINIQDKTHEFAMLIQFRTKEDFKAAMKGGTVYVGLFEYPESKDE